VGISQLVLDIHQIAFLNIFEDFVYKKYEAKLQFRSQESKDAK